MNLILFNNLTEKDKINAVERLITQSTPNQDYFLMIVLSILTAVFGILMGSIPVIIGSMLIAPLLSPILSLSLGVVISDSNLIDRSFVTIIKSVIIGAGTATIAALLFGGGSIPEELITSSEPSLLYAAVAIIAGFAASFALVKPKLNEMLPGVAIAVALIPPIALIGIGLADWSWATISGSFLVLITNIVGIVFAGMVTLSLMNFYTKKKAAEVVVKKEDEKLEQEKEQAEEENN